MKKAFLLAIAVLLLCSWTLGSVCAETSSSNDDFEIEGTTLVKYLGVGGEVTVPEGIEILGVYAFSESAVTKVNLPSTLKEIKSYCFLDCTALCDITLPASVENIETDIYDGYTSRRAQVFGRNDSLAEIKVDAGNQHYKSVDGVLFTIDGKKLLYYPSAKNVDGSYAIPEGTETIGYTAFGGSKFTSLHLPASMTACDGHDLQQMPLQEITVDLNNAALQCVNGILYTKDGNQLLYYPMYKSGETIRPDDFLAGVKQIQQFAFSDNKNLKSIELPGTVTSIEWGAFTASNALEQITLPASLNRISGFAFSNCPQLNNVTVLSSNVDIYSNAFTNSPSVVFYGYNGSTAEAFANQNSFSFVSLIEGSESPISGTCGENVTWTLDEDGLLTFSGTGEIPDDNDHVASYEAYRDQVRAISVQEGITRIGRYALYGFQNVEEISLPDSLTTIATGAFMACYNRLTSIRIPANVSSIERYAFNNCEALAAIEVDEMNTVYSSLDGVLMSKDQTTLVRYPIAKPVISCIVPDSVQTIGLGAFTGCFNLESILVPETVSKVEMTAFNLCPNLHDVTFKGMNTELGRELFYMSSQVTMRGRSGSTAEAYAESNSIPFEALPEPEITASGEWGALSWSLNNEGLLTVSGTGEMDAFDYNSTAAWRAYKDSIQKIVLENGITSISDYAFCEFISLTSVSIPDSVSAIGESALSSCYLLPDIAIPASVTDIDNTAFGSCDTLISIQVNQNNPVYSSQNGVVFNKDKTALLFFPGGIRGEYTIPDGVTEIGEWAFVYSKISNVVIPNSVTHIREKAFIYSFYLNGVTIPDSVRFIDREAFWNCNGLTSITISQSVVSIGESAFGSCYSLTNILVDENNSVYSSQDGVLFDKGKTTLVCFPVGKSGAYTIPASVTAIANRAFMYCSNLTSVVIPEGVTRIESETFFMCSNLESISLPASINAVDFFAFFRCSKLTDVYYGGTEEDWQAIEIIGNGNEYLTGATLHALPAADLVLPASLTVIESEAFAGLPSGTAIRIPSSVTFIAEDAFSGVDDLTILGVPGSEAEAFANAHDNITFIATGN